MKQSKEVGRGSIKFARSLDAQPGIILLPQPAQLRQSDQDATTDFLAPRLFYHLGPLSGLPAGSASVSMDPSQKEQESQLAITSANGDGEKQNARAASPVEASADVPLLRDHGSPQTGARPTLTGNAPHQTHDDEAIRPIQGQHPEIHTAAIRDLRPKLKVLNASIERLQETIFEDMTQGRNIRGYIVIGRAVHALPHSVTIFSGTRSDVRWSKLRRRTGSDTGFWTIVGAITAGICVTSEPQVLP